MCRNHRREDKTPNAVLHKGLARHMGLAMLLTANLSEPYLEELGTQPVTFIADRWSSYQYSVDIPYNQYYDISPSLREGEIQ